MTVSRTAYLSVREDTIQGRYVVIEQIIAFLEKLPHNVLVETLGYSVQARPIMGVTVGKGPHKILLWSQMHGNESTTTKAVLDMINYLGSGSDMVHDILENCTLLILPVLNPDGAAAYTRVNASKVDLNRDAQDRSQPESKVLRAIYERFQPDYCFNLHDQRTIFNVGTTLRPATVSFLAPAHDEERSISMTRATSMKLIVAMNNSLQKRIPGQVGRYDDAFNANCVGDTFQMLHTPTILFEAGHYPDDYEREITREYIFCALLAALDVIHKETIDTFAQADYFTIPENNKLYFDILIKNAHLLQATHVQDIGVLFHEVLKDGAIIFEPKIEKMGKLDGYYGHKIYDCSNHIDLETLKSKEFDYLNSSNH